MKYRMLSPTGDFMFGQSLQNFYIDVPAAPAQAVQTRLLLWQGEYWLDTNEGTPYPEGVIGKHSQSEADTVVQDRTLGAQGVTDISTFQSQVDPDTRGYSVSLEIDTVYGPTQVQLANLTNF